LLLLLLLLLGRPLQRSPRLRCFKWDWDEICSTVPHVNTQRPTESDFWYDVTILKCRPWSPFTITRKLLCCHVVSENEKSAAQSCSNPVGSWSVVQCTFVYLYSCRVQSDIVHQSVMELIHSEDREQFKMQLNWRSALSQDSADLTLDQAMQSGNNHEFSEILRNAY